ncbi:nucleotidyltransferase family protein [Neptunicella sp. SCSIO 80796]|uniref:nucleotidyltransferase family protein n=1 Tax=Neptunicella plasticusilytica TaxID=3117012 RepID=UPI003A4E0D41
MKVAIIVLAAGESRRFNGVKQLAMINGQPMICCVVRQFQQINGADLYVVLGANHQQIAEALPERIQTLYSRQWQRGIGQSIADAIKQLREGYTHILIGLADQVGIDDVHLANMLRAAEQYPDNIIATLYGQHMGVPAIFAIQDFTGLKQLRGDIGARQIIQQNQHRTTTIPFEQAAFDIDTRGDLQHWQRMQKEELE